MNEIETAWPRAPASSWPAIDRRTSGGSRERLVNRIRGEFLETPGLRLTMPQAARLFGLRPDVCGRILDGLVGEGTVRRGHDRRYGLY